MGIDNPDAIANSVSHYIYLTEDPESLNRSVFFIRQSDERGY